MTETTPSPLNNVITIDDGRIKNHLDRGRADAERTAQIRHYERKLQTKAGTVATQPKPKCERFTPAWSPTA